MTDSLFFKGTKFFFKQEDGRRIPRRIKKNLDDLPAGIRFTSKTKATTTTNSTRSADDFADTVSEAPTQDASIMLEEKPEVRDLKDTLQSLPEAPALESSAAALVQIIPDDSQHVVFENYKSLALLTLSKLGDLLHYFQLRRHTPKLPKTLEVALLSEFRELACDALFAIREWQTLSAKQSWDNESRKRNRDSTDETKSVIDSTSVSGEFQSDRASSRMEKESVNQLAQSFALKVKKSKGKVKPRIGLGNISEDEEIEGKQRTQRSGSGTSQFLGIPGRKKSDRLRPTWDQSSKASVSDRGQRRFGDDTSLMEGASEDSSRSIRGYYVSVIQFALSSRACEEKGWIVHDEASADIERQTVLEWARQRLSTSIRHREEQLAKEKELGHDKRVEVVHYGEAKKERVRVQKTAEVLNEHLYPEVPCLPETELTGPGSLFYTTTIDGTTSVFYPSGQLAVIYSQAGLGREGYYISVYDDNISRNMLASFTPHGRGVCYYKNGVARFLSTDKEILQLDQNGACQKRWAWPPSMTTKLPATVQIQLNSQVAFRCVSRSQMSIIFTQGRQTITLKMAHSLVQPELEDSGRLISGTIFTSQSAKEIQRQARFKSASQMKKEKKKKEKKPESKDKPEDATGENNADDFELESDRELNKLNMKIKALIDDWMTFYRASVHIGMKSMSPASARKSKSAKSVPGDLLRHPTPSLVVPPGRRVGTAPAGITTTSRPKTSFRLDASGQLTVLQTPTPSPSKSPRPPSAEREVADWTLEERRRAVCPVALCRQILIGDDDWVCRCSKHHMPSITDVEYDFFIQNMVPSDQMIVICVTSSLYPRTSQGCETMLEQVYADMNRNRSSPCQYSLSDPFRVFRYDMATCTDNSDHTQPLLMWRHNVIPGMILMYQGGKLLFADHIFNGYGNARKDFTKQVLKTKREARATGSSLPDDFRFSPQMGRRGCRSAWGGQIGGAGVDRYANPGVDARGTYRNVRRSQSASTNSTDSSLPVCATRQPTSLTSDAVLSSTYPRSASYPSYTPYDSGHDSSPHNSGEYQKQCLTAH